LATARLTSASFRLVSRRPSVNTAKLTLGAPVTTTAGTPLACSTAKADDELVAVSFAGSAAAAVSFSPSAPETGGGAGGAGSELPPSLPPPHATSAAAARTIAPHFIVERVIRCSINSWDSIRRSSWQ
jgi:hypothetical protein